MVMVQIGLQGSLQGYPCEMPRAHEDAGNEIKYGCSVLSTYPTGDCTRAFRR